MWYSIPLTHYFVVMLVFHTSRWWRLMWHIAKYADMWHLTQLKAILIYFSQCRTSSVHRCGIHRNISHYYDTSHYMRQYQYPKLHSVIYSSLLQCSYVANQLCQSADEPHEPMWVCTLVRRKCRHVSLGISAVLMIYKHWSLYTIMDNVHID